MYIFVVYQYDEAPTVYYIETHNPAKAIHAFYRKEKFKSLLNAGDDVELSGGLELIKAIENFYWNNSYQFFMKPIDKIEEL